MVKKNTRSLAIVAVLAAGGFATLAAAHGSVTASYGGQAVESGDLRIEFAVRDGGIRAWVRDHEDKPRAASGKAILLVGGAKLEVPLKTGADMLTADAPVKAADKVTAIVSLTVDGNPASARFIQEALVTPELSPAATAGKQAFDGICAQCHGAALRGTDNGPPLLHPMYAAGGGHGDDVVLAAMTNGAPQHMWRFGAMPKPELRPDSAPKILAYLRAMQAANGLGGGTATPPMVMDHSMMHGNHGM